MVTALVGGASEFKLYAPHASIVEILGDFTGWHDAPVEMTQDSAGWWSVRLTLKPGDYEFQYRIDARTWQADFAAHGVRRSREGAWVSRWHVPQVVTSSAHVVSAAA